MASIEVIAERPFQLDGRHCAKGDRIAVSAREAAWLRGRRYARLAQVVEVQHAAVVQDPVIVAPPRPAEPASRRRGRRRNQAATPTEPA